ncbi:MAG: hypothetical protein ACI3W5_02665 [Faecousia sp.]
MSIIHDELNKLGIACESISILQDKDGVTVARIISDKKSYVVKCFQKDEHKRELKNYRLLASLDIPTIWVIASTDSALLLEDIDCSSTYRLGIEEDMSDSVVARRIAVWYKQLHSQGYSYVCQHGESMYDEADFFTIENIVCIKKKTGTQDAPAWVLLEENYDAINDLLRKTRRTLTYNDFYYTNMVVAKDKSSALMFDYNLLGKGYAYTDVRNVLSSLSEEAGNAFIDEYGKFDPSEKALDDVVSVVVTLYLACLRDKFPWWAQTLLDEIDTTFIEKITFLRSFL